MKKLIGIIFILIVACNGKGNEFIGVWYFNDGEKLDTAQKIVISKAGDKGYLIKHYYYNYEDYYAKRITYCNFKDGCFNDNKDKNRTLFCVDSDDLMDVDNAKRYTKQKKH